MRERGFIFGRGNDNILRLYEIREDIPYDAIITDNRIVRKRIPWTIETGLIKPQSLDAYSLNSTYSLEDGSIGLSKVYGRFDYALSYKPDDYPEYTDWSEGVRCSKMETCVDIACPQETIPNLKEHVYVNILLGKPGVPSCNQATGKLLTLGHGFSFRMDFIGAGTLEYFTAKLAQQPKTETFYCGKKHCATINVCLQNDYEYDLATSELYYE